MAYDCIAEIPSSVKVGKKKEVTKIDISKMVDDIGQFGGDEGTATVTSISGKLTLLSSCYLKYKNAFIPYTKPTTNIYSKRAKNIP